MKLYSQSTLDCILRTCVNGHWPWTLNTIAALQGFWRRCFYSLVALPVTQPTASKHQRNNTWQFHQVFLGHPLHPVPLVYVNIHCLTKSVSYLRSACPNHLNLPLLVLDCLGGAVVRCWTRGQIVASLTRGRGAIKSTRSTQPSIPPG